MHLFLGPRRWGDERSSTANGSHSSRLPSHFRRAGANRQLYLRVHGLAMSMPLPERSASWLLQAWRTLQMTDISLQDISLRMETARCQTSSCWRRLSGRFLLDGDPVGFEVFLDDGSILKERAAHAVGRRATTIPRRSPDAEECRSYTVSLTWRTFYWIAQGNATYADELRLQSHSISLRILRSLLLNCYPTSQQ